jgi:hypothetical protein
MRAEEFPGLRPRCHGATRASGSSAREDPREKERRATRPDREEHRRWQTTPPSSRRSRPQRPIPSSGVSSRLGGRGEPRTTQDSLLGPGVPVGSTESFYWHDGGYFLVQTYETVFGNEPAQKGVNYWGYQSAAKRFRIIFFSNNGPFTEEGNRYQGEVARAKLTFEGQARFQYELDDQGRIKLNPDGTVSVPWWLRDKNGAWTPWMNNTFTKIQD